MIIQRDVDSPSIIHITLGGDNQKLVDDIASLHSKLPRFVELNWPWLFEDLVNEKS
jgi:hypothetical protein